MLAKRHGALECAHHRHDRDRLGGDGALVTVEPL